MLATEEGLREERKRDEKKMKRNDDKYMIHKKRKGI
jgi:hypothetical protein